MPDLSLSKAELRDYTEYLRRFVRERVETADADGVVLGLSGGVDSATVAGIAASTLDPAVVTGLILPAAPTSDRSLELAEAVASKFAIETRTVDIEPIVELALTAYPDEVEAMTRGNVRARARALYWYLVANEENRLVLGGGNRTEWTIGYFTKHGDAAVDCLPLAGLYKQQVRQLAEYLGVPAPTIDRKPTAELVADQTDEDELKMDYDTLDAILALHVHGPLSAAGTAEVLEVELGEINRIDNMVKASQHKRQLPAMPSPPSEFDRH